MDLSAYILEDLHPGDRVELTCARTGTCEGEVLALDGTMLLLKTRRGRRRLALDTIESYEVLEAETEEEPPAPPEPQEPEPPAERDWEKELEGCSSIHERFRLLEQRGDKLRQEHRYGEALDCWTQWQELYESELQTLGGQEMEAYAGALNAVKLNMACCYYFLGRREQAEALAHKLRRINAADETVRAILRGDLREDRLPGMSEMTPRRHPARERDSGGGDDGNMSRFSPYARWCIGRTDLGEVLGRRGQERLVRAGRFCGEPEEAARMVEDLLCGRDVSRRQRGEHRLAAARIIHQTWESRDDAWREDRGKPPVMACGNMYLCTGQGLLTWGEDLMFAPVVVLTGEGFVQADSVRFHCLAALDLVLERRELMAGPGSEVCAAALGRYVQTFFYDRERMQDLIRRDEEREPAALPDTYAVLEDTYELLSEGGRRPLVEGEFALGLVRLVRVLMKERPRGDRDQARSLLESLLTGLVEGDGWEALQEELEHLGLTVRGPTASELLLTLMEAGVLSAEVEKRLQALLEDAAQRPLGGLSQSQRLCELKEGKWLPWLTASDRERLRQGVCLLSRLDAEGDLTDFERRDDLISTVSEQLVRLNEEIARWPTHVSFHILRPALVQVREKLALEQKRLYAHAPRITIRESGELRPYLVSAEKQVVAVHLTVSNATGVQMADRLRLEVKEPSGLRYVADREACIRGLRGGEEREVCLRFRVEPGVMAFHTEIGCRYSYKKDAQNLTEGQMEKPLGLTVVVPQETEPIENIFVSLANTEMKNEKLFKGRGPLIEKILGTMQTRDGALDPGHGFALYGQTRAGKSSILYHLRRKVEETFGDRVLILDLGNLDELNHRESDLFRSLLCALISELDNLRYQRIGPQRKRSGAAGILAELENRLGYDLGDWEDRTEGWETGRLLDCFNDLMRKLDAILADPEDGTPRMLLVLLDEFSILHTAMLEHRLDPGFMPFWRAFLQNHRVFAVVAGQDDMPQFIRENQNAFMTMHLEKVTYLDGRSARELCSEPLVLPDGTPRYVDTALDAMYRLTAGSPYLILKLSAGLVDYLNRRGAARITDAILEGFLRESVFCGGSILSDSVDFSAQLQDRSDVAPQRERDNRRVLTAVALDSRRGGRAELRELERVCRPELDGDRVEEVLSRLVERDVLLCQREKSGCYYHIVVELLERWLLYMSGNGDGWKG